MTRPAEKAALKLVESIAESPEKARKKKKPAVERPELAIDVAAFLEARGDEHEAKQTKEQVAERIIAATAPDLVRLSREAGKVLSSIGVNTKLTLTKPNKWSPIEPEKAGALKAAFGSDAPRYFRQKLSIELAPEAAKDGKLLAKIVKALGVPGFKAAFSVTKSLVVTDAFHDDVILRPEVCETAKPFLTDGTLKPERCSLRVA